MRPRVHRCHTSPVASLLAHAVDQVLIPTEKIYQIRKGKKISKEKNYFPGYVLIQCALIGEVEHVIKSMTNIIGFLGATKGGDPLPMRQSEVNRILGKVDELAVSDEEMNIPYVVGDDVDSILKGFDTNEIIQLTYHIFDNGDTQFIVIDYNYSNHISIFSLVELKNCLFNFNKSSFKSTLFLFSISARVATIFLNSIVAEEPFILCNLLLIFSTSPLDKSNHLPLILFSLNKLCNVFSNTIANFLNGSFI